jgi:hypothetical protein
VLGPVTALATYFEGLAASWRGWTGEKAWHDDEGQVSLIAIHDGKGLVMLDVEIRDMAYQGRAIGEPGRTFRSSLGLLTELPGSFGFSCRLTFRDPDGWNS